MSDNYDVIAKLDKICVNILTSSRNELYMNMRYLTMAFNGLRYAMSNDTPTIGTDGYYFYYSPAFLMQVYQSNKNWINRGYLHMIFHCIFKHPVNMEDRDERVWNVSCDIITEMIIDDLKIRQLKKDSSSMRKMVYQIVKDNIKVPTAESIYRLLMGSTKLRERLGEIEEDFFMDDHSFWIQYKTVEQPQNSQNQGDNGEGEGNGDDDDGEGNGSGNGEGNNKPNKNAEDFKDKWNNISQKTQTDMETTSRQASDSAGELQEFLSAENRQRYDFRSFLRKFAVQREIMQLDMDSYDYVYYTYGLKMYGNMPLIESLEYKETKKVEEFVIVIDTSASCESDLVRIFLEETYSILKDSESFFRKINIHIIQCDNKIQSDQLIVCKEDFEQYMKSFEIKGRGGTDFEVAFNYVNDLCHEKKITELKGLIYFTDGCGNYPKTKPDYEAAFVFVSDNYEDTGVPPWAIEIILDKEEIYSLGGI